MSDPVDAHAVVSHEQDGRVLSGVGVSVDQLAETMDRHAPADETPAAPEPAPAGAPPAAPSTEPEQLSRGRKRYWQLRKEADDASARAAAAERERDELKARLSQPPAPDGRLPGTMPAPGMEGDASRQAASSQQPPQPQAPLYTRPKPTEDEVGTKYATYADFTEDLHRWGWEQEQPNIQALIRQSIEADRAQHARQSHIESTRMKGRAAYADFDAVLKQGPGAYVTMPVQAIDAIYYAPNSEHLQYAIMRDGALAQKLAHLAVSDPYGFGLELARIAPVTPAASSASTGTSGSVTPPAPMQPVGSGSKTTVTPSAELVKAGFDFDKSGYRERRAAERGLTRRSK